MAPVRFVWDEFVLDTDSYRLERGGSPVALEPKVFSLLVLMVSRPGHLFTKQEIFDAIWPSTAVSDHALTRAVAQLRRALGDEARESRYLETVPTRGYRWVRPVEIVSAETGALEHAAGTAGESPLADAPSSRNSRRFERALLPVGVTVLCALAAAAATRWFDLAPGPGPSSAGAPVTPRFPVQVTTHRGLDLHPAFSPAGDAIAFASDRSGAFEIYVRAVAAGGDDTAMTGDGGQNVQPAWSPDGRWLAYHSAGKGGVWVMPARGGTPRQLVSRGSAPRWSPDGRLIAYQSDEQVDIAPTGFGAQMGSSIWLVDASGGRPRPLTSSGRPAGAHGLPAWSRSGRYVAFSVFDGGDDDGIWVARVDTGALTHVERDARGYEVIFASGDTALYVAGGTPVIFRVPFEPVSGQRRGATLPIVVPGVGGVRGLNIAPDDHTLVFAGVSVSSHIWAQPIGPDGEASGSARAITSDTSRRSYAPAISPDGARVSYMSVRSGEAPNIWVMSVDGTGDPLQITTGGGMEYAPSWLPDARSVAYLSAPEYGAGTSIRGVDVITRRDEPIVEASDLAVLMPGFEQTGHRLAEMNVSPSAAQIAFTLALRPSGHRRLFVTPRSTLSARALADDARSVGYPVWSPDERYLAVQIQEVGATHLGVVDPSTGALRQVTRTQGQTWAGSWSPDGRRVAAAVLLERLWRIEWVDVASGDRGVITPPASTNVYYRYPEWSPRGDLVLFERGETRGNIWMLGLQ